MDYFLSGAPPPPPNQCDSTTQPSPNTQLIIPRWRAGWRGLGWGRRVGGDPLDCVCGLYDRMDGERLTGNILNLDNPLSVPCSPFVFFLQQLEKLAGNASFFIKGCWFPVPRPSSSSGFRTFCVRKSYFPHKFPRKIVNLATIYPSKLTFLP